MLSTRTQFLLVSIAYLLLTPVSAQSGWWGPNNGGNWSGNCPPFAPSSVCNSNGNNNGGSNGGSNSGGNTNPSQEDLTPEEISKSTKVITIHAVLACLVWVCLIPTGGVLLRLGINSPWVVRIHAVLQSLSFVIYVIAAAMGLWLVRNLSYGSFSLWNDPHPKIGMTILLLAFLQPFFGFIHHRIYKKRAQNKKAGLSTKPPGRTAVGYIHLWLGRFLIVLGVINGGLGLKLASYSPYETHSKTKIIVYGVASGIMLVLYFLIVILGEIRRSKANRDLNRQQGEIGRNVPLLNTSSVPPRGYMSPISAAGNVPPPTYEDSQEDVRKVAQSTARYT